MNRIQSKSGFLVVLMTVCGAVAVQVQAQSTTGWETVQSTSSCTARHENAFTKVGEKLYLIGGRGTRPVDEYDPETNSWKQLAAPPVEMNHFQAIEYKNEAYVMGAFMGSYPHEKPIASIYIFNPSKNEWREGPAIPADRLRGAAGSVVYKDKLYLVCGIQDGHYDGHVGWLDEYDPKTNTWRKLPDAPHVRDHVSVAVIDNKLYVAGGRRSTARINQVLNLTEPAVDVFDFKTNTWTTLPESMNLPTQRAGNTAVPFGYKLLIMGGESPAQVEAHAEVEAFDTKTMKWEKWPKLNKGRHGTGATIYKKKVYVAAGSGNRGGGPELTSMEVLKEK